MVLSNIIHNNNISNNIIYLIVVFIYNNQKYLSIVQLIINLQYCLRCYIPIILLSNARHFNMCCYGWEAKQSICQVLAVLLAIQFSCLAWSDRYFLLSISTSKCSLAVHSCFPLGLHKSLYQESREWHRVNQERKSCEPILRWTKIPFYQLESK